MNQELAQNTFIGARLPPDLVAFLDAVARRDGHGNRSAAMRKILVAVMDASGGEIPALPADADVDGADGGTAAKAAGYDGRSAAAKRHERMRRQAKPGGGGRQGGAVR